MPLPLRVALGIHGRCGGGAESCRVLGSRGQKPRPFPAAASLFPDVEHLPLPQQCSCPCPRPRLVILVSDSLPDGPRRGRRRAIVPAPAGAGAARSGHRPERRLAGRRAATGHVHLCPPWRVGGVTQHGVSGDLPLSPFPLRPRVPVSGMVFYHTLRVTPHSPPLRCVSC